MQGLDACQKAAAACSTDPEAPLVAYVSKMVAIPASALPRTPGQKRSMDVLHGEQGVQTKVSHAISQESHPLSYYQGCQPGQWSCLVRSRQKIRQSLGAPVLLCETCIRHMLRLVLAQPPSLEPQAGSCSDRE